MRRHFERPWFGPGEYGKIRPVTPAGYFVLFGTIALVLALLALAQGLPHLLLLALVVALVVAALATMVLTYGPAKRP